MHILGPFLCVKPAFAGPLYTKRFLMFLADMIGLRTFPLVSARKKVGPHTSVAPSNAFWRRSRLPTEFRFVVEF
ncbi:hypothetical protein P691DRAFT_813134 [Macrolepiota fuliginosa MF-IS2]|uniref:Uncharacterized protein n=1 Tax=Macrolepiota fuliginosa MF-IS2 TaxID=1400762 RepID=A0A9P5XDQ3_9AGAR|nr:hypothetical protein P691DRAFT_813134 [Macrolepiota fuliginosa MF-IS2]